MTKYEDAIKDYDKSLSLNPNFYGTYCNRGIAKYYLKNYVEALVNLDKAIIMQPDCHEAYVYRAKIYEYQGDYDDMQKDMTYVYKNLKKEENAYNKYLYGVVLLSFKEYEQAIEWFDKALNDNYRVAPIYLDKSKAYYELGKKEEAIKTLDYVAKINILEPTLISYKKLYVEGKQEEKRILPITEKSNSTPQPPKSEYNPYYALIIGVKDYQDVSMNLNETLNDAQKVIKALTTYYTFKSENITFLKNAKRADIIAAFTNLRKKLTDKDNLLVFYAGHAHYDTDLEQGYWLPADATKENPANWVSNSDIKESMRAMACKHTLLISDACFSGSLIIRDAKISTATPDIKKLYAMKSRKAMTSGSLKPVPDKSVFLKYLLQKLETNTEKFSSASDLFNQIRKPVINNSPNFQVPQFGAIHGSGDEGGEFIFIKKD